MKVPFDIRDAVPGGIQVTDFVHERTNDGSCSRCRREVDEGEVPLMLFIGPGDDMLIFCPECCGFDDYDEFEP